MKAVKIETDGSIKLPEEMLRLFPTSTELAVCNDTRAGSDARKSLIQPYIKDKSRSNGSTAALGSSRSSASLGFGRKQSQLAVWRFNKIKSELGSGGDASRSCGGGRDLYATGTR